MAFTTATQMSPYPAAPSLHIGIELSGAKWGLALSAARQRIREGSIRAGDCEQLLEEVQAANRQTESHSP